jgi:hypothetical protein
MANSARLLATNSLSNPVLQVGHGLVKGKVVRLSAGSFIAAQADTEAHAQVVGMVSGVADVDHIFVMQEGFISGLSGLVANTLYYLSPSSSGDLTSSIPTGGTQAVLPCFIAYTTTSGYFFGSVGHVPYVPINGGIMTGLLQLSGDPVGPLDAVTKEYADTISAGLTVKPAVVATSTANLTAAYANGAGGVGATLTNTGAMAAFSTDGVSPALNDRVLVAFQTAQEENGIYTLTTVGSGAVNWVLTRATDYDTNVEIQPGNLVPVTQGTLYAQTSWLQSATVTVVGTDPILFSQFTASPSTFAKKELNNLSGVSINSALPPDTDNSYDLGTLTARWQDIYALTLNSGGIAANTLNIRGYNPTAVTYTDFLTITSNNPPTASLNSAVTATTQAANDNSTKISTTAYADTLGALKANVSLNNLSAVAINTSLLPGADNTIDAGDGTHRYRQIYSAGLSTGHTAADALNIGAWDVDGAAFTAFITLTANNTPTCSLASAVTATTQAANDNSTRIATTAYVDASAASGAPTNATYITQTPNAGLSAEQALSLLTTGLMKNTTATGVVSIAAAGTDYVDPATTITIAGTANEITSSAGAQDLSTNRTWTLSLPAALTFTGKTITGGALSGMSATTFTFTTGSIGTAVTAVTQAPSTNNTTIATTAYTDAAVAAGGSGANTALSNLAAVAINTTLLSDTDNTDDLGTATVRWANIYGLTHRTGTGAGNTMILQARDVDGAAWVDFITLTANNTPTCALASDVTATTQAASNNSTKIATTAYVDAAVGGGSITIGKAFAMALLFGR